MNPKTQRLSLIKKIASLCKTQKDLIIELKRMGHNVTQATVSRNLRELDLVRTPYGYREVKKEPVI